VLPLTPPPSAPPQAQGKLGSGFDCASAAHGSLLYTRPSAATLEAALKVRKHSFCGALWTPCYGPLTPGAVLKALEEEGAAVCAEYAALQLYSHAACHVSRPQCAPSTD